MRKIGSIVWYMHKNCDEPIKGKIYEIFDHECVKEESYCMVQQETACNTESRTESECFDKKEDCQAAIEKRNQGRKETIKKMIKNKDDLVRFMYTHFADHKNIYDYCAMEAVKDRAYELGIKIGE